MVDLGPGAGEHGGEVVFAGEPEKILKSRKSLTGKYLTGKKRIQIPKIRRETKVKKLILFGASGNNLRSIDVIFPLGKFILVS